MIPEKKYPLRLYYMFRDELCTVIDIDTKHKKVDGRLETAEKLYGNTISFSFGEKEIRELRN